MRLIVATRNQSKLREIRQILNGIDLRIVSLSDLKKKIRIVENGKTFSENAIKKAMAVSKLHRDDCVLGEDSGLEVDYLRGAPGIYSKRYASMSGNQVKNNNKLLKELCGVPALKRGAQFRCTLALACGGKMLTFFEGKLRGRIHGFCCGTNGFGYDPVFYLPAYKKTVAQLKPSEKNKISHRAKAFRKLAKFLKEEAEANLKKGIA